MGSLDEFVRATIDAAASPPALPDPGIGACLSGTTYAGAGTGWNTSEKFRSYRSEQAASVDWASGTPERRAAKAWFAQNPGRQFDVLKLTVAPQLGYAFTVRDTVASTRYALTVEDSSGVEHTYYYVSDAAPESTDDEVVTGLKSYYDANAISGVTCTLTGSATSKKLQLTGAAGVAFYPKLYDSDGTDMGPAGLDLLSMDANTADTSTAIADQIASLRLQRDAWYKLINPYPGKALNQAIATALVAIADSAPKLLFALDPSSECVLVAVGSATDLGTTLKGLGNSRCAVIYHHLPAEEADAAMAGSRARFPPGTYTYAFVPLANITPTVITDTHRSNLKAKYINWYEGYGLLADGSDARATLQKGRTCSGMFIDEREYRDLLTIRLKLAGYQALADASARGGKINDDEGGVDVIRGYFRAVFLADTASKALKSFDLGYPDLANRSAQDKADRILGDFPFTAVYSNGVHEITIRGVVSI